MKRVTLESRVARLEKLLKNEGYGKFENDLNERGARREAASMAKRFMAQTGYKLVPVTNYPIISSPLYGWMESGDEIEEDDVDARYAFTYEFEADPEVIAVMIPSDGTVQVFENESGTALDPLAGEWFEADLPQDDAFPLSDWKHFDLPIDEYDESYSRH